MLERREADEDLIVFQQSHSLRLLRKVNRSRLFKALTLHFGCPQERNQRRHYQPGLN